ncbi:MAG: aspartate--ammonia ligase [Spirochaetales bacterium]|nr:aspartate--ammonia ligase [Spirochaetales bacterium]
MSGSKELTVLETEQAILYLKRYFEDHLARALQLSRVSSPLFVEKNSGIQDNLNGIERAVSFEVKDVPGTACEIVHSLAKWKRLALAEYGIDSGRGLYTDMNALRPDEENLHTGIHSVYVDQWDWERVMEQNERNIEYLKETVRSIYRVIRSTEKVMCSAYDLDPFLPEDIHFIHTEELLKAYPDKTSKEREDLICREYGAVFLIGIGGELSHGEIHDGRAPDYDDWTTPNELGFEGLNGDILVWNPVIKRSFELSSMGIRVDREALLRQLELRNSMERAELTWHRKLLNEELPQTIGGGIGQSRLCMLILQKRHIGEVQVGIWPEDELRRCRKEGIHLL